MKSVHLKRQELTGETEIAVQRMLKKAFPDVVGDYFSAACPSASFCCWTQTDRSATSLLTPPFSVLVAYEPKRYRSSGYRIMTNEMRFLENGQWRQFVHREGMVAQLSERKWPNKLLNLRGPVV